MRLFAIMLILFLPLFSMGQRHIELPDRPDKVLFSGHWYPATLDQQVHQASEVELVILPELRIGLQTFYDKFGARQRIRVPFFAKFYISEKLYLMAGPEAEYDVNAEISENDRLRLSVNFGMGYELNKNMFFEAKFNQPINESKLGASGDLGNNQVFTLGTKAKF